MSATMCEHWWRTDVEPGYGFVSVCAECGKRESAEHRSDCPAMTALGDAACNCGEAAKFTEYEKREVTNG